MSDYFQRLLQQSDVLLQPQATPANAAAPVANLPRPVGSSAAVTQMGDDLVEVHEEVVAEPSGASMRIEVSDLGYSRPPDHTASSRTLRGATEIARLDPPAAPSTPPASATTVVEQNVVVEATRSAARSNAPILPPVATPSAAEMLAIAPQPRAPQPNATPLASEVLDAVMKWIGAGSPAGESAPGEIRDSNNPSQQLAASEPTPSAEERVTSEAPPSPKIPERVIRLVEVQPTPAPQPVRVVAARPVAPTPTPAPAPNPEQPVRVSIGSIQVHVEAPAPTPPKPLRPSRPTEPARTPSRATRSSVTSQLRRHYIIPH